MEFVKLRNGLELSSVGFGSYPLRPHQILRIIPRLSGSGINFVDTAHDYENEVWLGLSNKLNRNQNLCFSTKMSVGQQRERKKFGGVIQEKYFYKALES